MNDFQHTTLNIEFELFDEQINELLAMLDTLKHQLTPTGNLARIMLSQFEEKYCREVSRGNNVRPNILKPHLHL